MKNIITAIAAIAIAIASVTGTSAVASADTDSVKAAQPGPAYASTLPVCMPWLIEHAKPCLPDPISPTHSRHHHAWPKR